MSVYHLHVLVVSSDFNGNLLISLDYKRHELQWRFNLFFCAYIIAGAFSGLLAYAIAHMDGLAGYSGWR